MKTVAITLNTTWNIYNFRLNLMKYLRAQGYEVIAISPKDDYVEKLEDEGFKWYELKLDNDSTNPIKELFTIYNFYKVYKKAKPDIILQYTIKPNIYGTLAANMLDIPVINNVSGLGTIFLHENLASKVAKFLYKVAFKYPKKVFFQNTHDQKLFIESGLINQDITDIVPGSGVDTEKFKPISILTPEKFSFLFIGRLLKEKGIGEYIRAIKDIKSENPDIDVDFKIIGEFYPKNPSSISKRYLYSLIEDNILKYETSTDNIKYYIASNSCIVLPSYREGLSKVLLESASMAKPIITTDVPGCKDVVDDNITGFLCKVKDADDLKEKMIKMINLPEETRKQMGKKGREKIIKEFSDKVVFEKYLKAVQYHIN